MATLPIAVEERDARIQFIPAYVSNLRQQTGLYIGYIPNTYADQPTQDQFDETLRRDPEIQRCGHLLSLMAAGERVKVKTDDPKLAKVIAFFLGEVRDFLHARKSILEKGVLLGLGILKKEYDHCEWKGYDWEVCSRLLEVDRRRLRIERDDINRDYQYWTIWMPQFDKYIQLEDKALNPNAPYSLQDYVWYTHDYEELKPYGNGFGDSLYSLVYIKNKCLQYWGDLCESWSKPFLVIAIDMLKSAFSANTGDAFTTAESRIQELFETFEKARSRHIAVVDKGDEIGWHEHGTSGQNLIRELMEYCDKRIQFLYFGTELATQSGNYGSYKLGLVHKAETDTIIMYNRKRLEETLKHDLIYDLLLRNQENLQKIGIEIPRPSEIQIEITVDQEEQQDQQQQRGQPGGMPQMGGMQ